MIRTVAPQHKLFFVAMVITILLLPTLFSVPAQAGEQLPLFLNGQQYPITIMQGLTQNEWLVSLRELSEETGLSIGWLEESKTVRIKDGGTIAYVQVGSEVALVNSEERFLSEPLQLTNGRLLMPLSFLAQTFQFTVDLTDQGIMVTTPTETISGIYLGDEEGRTVVSIRTSGIPRFESYLLTNPDRIVVDFYDARIDLNGDLGGLDLLPADSDIKGIRWDQFKANVARVVVDLKRTVGFEVVPAIDGKGISLALYKRIEKLSFQRIFGKAQLQIMGSAKVDYSVSYLHSPERLVIDMDKATLATPAQEITVSDSLVSKIRVNQFLPHIVRAVLELKYPAGCAESPTGDPQLVVLELLKKITGVEVSTYHGQESFLIKGSGLDEYAVEFFPEQAQILVDIPSAQLSTDQPRHTFVKGPVSDVKLLQVSPTAVQVQLGLRGYLGHKAVQTEEGLRVVVNSSPLAGRKIVIDPGHGGQDPGAIGRTGLMEKDVVLEIGTLLQNLLEAEGAEVTMTRAADRFIPLLERAAISRRVEPEAYVSIHVNSSVNREANGTETYYYYTDPKGQEMAALIQREMLASLELNNRAPRPNRDFVVLKETDVPSILTEVAFISNKNEEKMMRRPDFRQKAAEAIFRGLQAYFAGPSWQYRDQVSGGSLPEPEPEPDKIPEEPVGPEGKTSTNKEFTWEPIGYSGAKPGDGIVDKVKVIEIK